MTTPPKRIPYAIADYREIVDGGYHFVDKTRFIRELEHYKIPVLLRPRRFGKSLWCSILECYYDVTFADRFEELFGHTDIGQNPTAARNSHLVLRLDFSKILVKADLQALEEAFNRVCYHAFRRFVAKHEAAADFSAALEAHSAVDGLESILGTVGVEGTPPVHVIIDEYDNFSNQLLTARADAVYRALTPKDSFLRAFYKVIKAGVGEGTVARVFVTGVLPVTMDDLTSGFNIGQIITLEDHVLEMMGFTQAEVDAYVDEIFAERGWPTGTREQVRDELRTHYNGYRLLPGVTETLYNSTICNYYLNKLVIGQGRIPTERVDDNLRVDVNWLRRLAGTDEEARRLLEQLMFEGSLPVDVTMVRSKFNMEQFFQREFLPLSLYYLGMLTFENRFTLTFPNLTVKTIFTEYFNELERIQVSLGYQDAFAQYLRDHDLEALFAAYWKQYIGQIPAQALDKANENFFRTTFYEICTRYLSPDFMFAIEVNHPSGRSDWEAIGRAETPFADRILLLEFKHFPLKQAEQLGVFDWSEPREDDVARIDGYAADLARKHPDRRLRRHVVYTLGAKGYRFFTLD